MQNFVNNFFEYQKSKYEYDFFTNFKKIEKENEDFLNLNIKKRILWESNKIEVVKFIKVLLEVSKKA